MKERTSEVVPGNHKSHGEAVLLCTRTEVSFLQWSSACSVMLPHEFAQNGSGLSLYSWSCSSIVFGKRASSF